MACGALDAVNSANAAQNNFLRHTDLAHLQQDLASCKAKAGGCSDAQTKAILAKYDSISSQNIAAVQHCIAQDDTQCVAKLEGQAASATQVDGAIPGGYGAVATVLDAQQTNAAERNAVSGTTSQAGSDLQLAQAVANFRAQNCGGLSAAQCDAAVNTALGSGTKVAAALLAGALTLGAAPVVAGVAEYVYTASATQAAALASEGPAVYCTLRPQMCLAAVDTAAQIASGSAAPSAVPSEVGGAAAQTEQELGGQGGVAAKGGVAGLLGGANGGWLSLS